MITTTGLKIRWFILKNGFRVLRKGGPLGRYMFKDAVWLATGVTLPGYKPPGKKRPKKWNVPTC